MVNNQSLTMRGNRCGHISPLKHFPDELGLPNDPNKTMSIRFTYEETLPFSNRQIQMAQAILIVINMEMRRQMRKIVPGSTGKNTKILCALGTLAL